MARLEVVCRRLPFTSTSVWLGLRPRILACSVWLAMSPPKAWAVNDGTTFASEFMRSGRPADCSSSALSTCTGELLVYSSRPVVRVPVTITVSAMESAAASALASSWAYSTARTQAMPTASESAESRPLCAARGRNWITIKTSLDRSCGLPDAERRTPSQRLPIRTRMRQHTCDAPAWRRPRDAPGKSDPDVANIRPTARDTRARARRRCLTTAGFPQRVAELGGTRRRKNSPRAVRRGPLANLHTGVLARADTPVWCARRAPARE